MRAWNLISLFLTLAAAWYFYIDGDPHARQDPPAVRKDRFRERLELLNASYPLDFILVAGDLTNHGTRDELAVYLDFFHALPVYATIGNHDLVNGTRVVSHHLKKTLGATYRRKRWRNGYYFFVHKGVAFYSLGLYPRNLRWLQRNLPRNTSVPVVFFYHFNTLAGEPMSDWWLAGQKRKFYQAIKDYRVLLIVNGHYHNSGINYWQSIPVVRASGREFAIVCVHDQKIKSIFFK